MDFHGVSLTLFDFWTLCFLQSCQLLTSIKIPMFSYESFPCGLTTDGEKLPLDYHSKLQPANLSLNKKNKLLMLESYQTEWESFQPTSEHTLHCSLQEPFILSLAWCFRLIFCFFQTNATFIGACKELEFCGITLFWFASVYFSEPF